MVNFMVHVFYHTQKKTKNSRHVRGYKKALEITTYKCDIHLNITQLRK